MTADRDPAPPGDGTRMPGIVPSGRIATRRIDRHDDDLVVRLRAVPDVTSAVADALDHLGVGAAIPGHRLARAAGTGPVCGPAVTLRYAALGGDVTAHRERRSPVITGDRDLYGLAGPGDIAVMDASACRDIAVFGGLSARWAALAGLAGCVIDGAVRDSATLRELGFPVWSTGRNPACARHRMETVELNGPVSLSGRLVRPGDYLVADDDGVCVIPHDAFPDVVEHCLAGVRAEAELVHLLNSADDVADVVHATRGRRTAT
ncbi:RraA family protein [Spirillospora sp. CA-255316]